MAIIINPSITKGSKSDIKHRALEELGVIEIGQSPESQHFDRIEDAYIETYTKLKVEGLATWSFTGTINNELVPFVVLMTAKNGLNSFGVSNDRYQRIISQAGPNNEIALREIRSLVTPRYESQEDPTDY